MRNTGVLSLCALALLSACKTADSAVDGIKSAGSAAADGVTGVATSLVRVDLSNVLNDLALDLKVDKSNIPVNAQIPISVAANVCGISINILTIGGGGTARGCTATTSSPELAQAVQQQLAAQGSVGGGAQTGSGAPTTAAPATGTTTTTTVPAPATGTTATGTTTAPATGTATTASGTSAPTAGATLTTTTTAPAPATGTAPATTTPTQP